MNLKKLWLILPCLSMTGLYGCVGNSTQPQAVNQQLLKQRLAEAGEKPEAIADSVDGVFSPDHPLTAKELYAIESTKVAQDLSVQKQNPQAVELLANLSKTPSNPHTALKLKVVNRNSTMLNKQLANYLKGSWTYLYCYATGWVNIDGKHLPLDGSSKSEVSPDSYHIARWALDMASPKYDYYTFDYEYPRDHWYSAGTHPHLVYYSKTDSFSKLESICISNIKSYAEQSIIDHYPGHTIDDVTISSVDIRGRDNYLSYDHPILPLQAKTNDKKITTIVSFGDSLSDTDATSNMVYWYAPNRKTWFAGHFSDGWTWPEYAAHKLGVIPYNEAWASAGVHNQPIINTYPWANSIQKLVDAYFPQLSEQPNYYHSNVDTLAARDPDTTLYTILIGGNDLMSYNETPQSIQAGVRDAIHNLITNNHAKNILVLNLPDISIAPVFSLDKKDIREKVLDQLTEYDNSLPDFVEGLNLVYKNYGVKISLYDTKKEMKQVYDKPSEYGIINVKDSCLINPDSSYHNEAVMHNDCNGLNYLFWDSVHPTTRVHEIIGNSVADFIKQNYTI